MAKIKELPELNEELISEVLKHIKEFPDAYNQNCVTACTKTTDETPCGAIGCFGGWAFLLSVPKEKRFSLAGRPSDHLRKAEKLLGLTSDEADYLFDMATLNTGTNYKIIVHRLDYIRASRNRFEKLQHANLAPMPKSTLEDNPEELFDYMAELLTP